MAFRKSGPSVALSVTDAGQSTTLAYNTDQARVYNEGPNDVRFTFGKGAQTVDDQSILLPAGLVEVYTINDANTFAAKCKTGETATIHIVGGQGD